MVFAYIILGFSQKIPFGLIVGKPGWEPMCDNREAEIGMTNVMRIGGKGPGILTFILDFAKLAGSVSCRNGHNSWWNWCIIPILLLSLVMTSAVCGHIFSIFLHSEKESPPCSGAWPHSNSKSPWFAASSGSWCLWLKISVVSLDDAGCDAMALIIVPCPKYFRVSVHDYVCSFWTHDLQTSREYRAFIERTRRKIKKRNTFEETIWTRSAS